MNVEGMEIFDISRRSDTVAAALALGRNSGTLVSSARGSNGPPEVVSYVGFAVILDVSAGQGNLISAKELKEQLGKFRSDFFQIAQEDPAGGTTPKRILMRTCSSKGGSDKGYRTLGKDALDCLITDYEPIFVGTDAPGFDQPEETSVAERLEQNGITRAINLDFEQVWKKLEPLRFSELLMLCCNPLRSEASPMCPARALIIRKQ